jgi:hypothetical protein
MSKRLLCILGGIVLSLAAVSAAFAQTTQTVTTTQSTAVQNADGSWTVVEYPVDKEVVVDLAPSTKTITNMARARVLRSANGTVITVDPAGFAGATGNYNLYAVDPLGHVSLLGPINATSTSPLTYNTNLGKFMLVVSPEGNLTTFAPDTTVAYRSAVPQGFAVIPLTQSGPQDGAPVGERVSATATSGATPTYNVPMLGIPNFRRGTDTHLKVHFPALADSRANIFLEPRKDGPTQIKLRFHSLKRVPANTRLVLWAVGPDNSYVRLGQVINTGERNEAQIQTETNLQDFGLIVTMENADSAPQPAGQIYATIEREQ